MAPSGRCLTSFVPPPPRGGQMASLRCHGHGCRQRESMRPSADATRRLYACKTAARASECTENARGFGHVSLGHGEVDQRDSWSRSTRVFSDQLGDHRGHPGLVERAGWSRCSGPGPHSQPCVDAGFRSSSPQPSSRQRGGCHVTSPGFQGRNPYGMEQGSMLEGWSTS